MHRRILGRKVDRGMQTATAEKYGNKIKYLRNGPASPLVDSPAGKLQDVHCFSKIQDQPHSQEWLF